MSTGKDSSIYSLSMWDPETECQRHITETQALAWEPRQPPCAVAVNAQRAAVSRARERRLPGPEQAPGPSLLLEANMTLTLMFFI